MRTRLLLLLALHATAHAGIEWDNTDRSVDAKLGEAQVSADYHFKNTGTSTLRVLKVQSSCGCTVAGVDKDELKPGGAGTLTAVFNIGGRTGHQEKVIVVMTDDAKQPESALKLRVDITEILRVRTRMVAWSGDGPFAPQTVAVNVAEGVPVTELSAQPSSQEFEAKVNGPDAKTHGYSLIITPKVTKKPSWAVITLRARISPDSEKTASVYVVVK
jgi:hypothetical protein